MLATRMIWHHQLTVLFGSAVAVSCLFTAIVTAQEPKMNSKRLLIATREVPPFSMKSKNGQWIGISIELLREIKADLESGTEYETELEFREMGLEKMLNAVEQGEVDLAAAAITVNYNREKRIDFTHPFHSTGLGIAVSGTQVRGWDRVMSAIFSLTFLKVLAGLFAVLLAGGIAVYFFERKQNPTFGGGIIKGIASGIWWAAVTMTTVGYGDKVPKTAGGRIIACFWMFSGLFIIASFTAAVTSALTVTQLKSRIAGPADLSRVRVATMAGSTSEQYLRSRHIISKKHPDVRSALFALQAGQIDAVVYDSPILRYEAHQYFSGVVQVLPVTFERQDYAFALPTGSPLRERINLVLLRKIGSPEWKNVLADYLGEQFE
jgi:polar amino acid transport system substrate-binding protein